MGHDRAAPPRRARTPRRSPSAWPRTARVRPSRPPQRCTRPLSSRRSGPRGAPGPPRPSRATARPPCRSCGAETSLERSADRRSMCPHAHCYHPLSCRVFPRCRPVHPRGRGTCQRGTTHRYRRRRGPPSGRRGRDTICAGRSGGTGRRAGLKIRCPQGRVGSIPTFGTGPRARRCPARAGSRAGPRGGPSRRGYSPGERDLAVRPVFPSDRAVRVFVTGRWERLLEHPRESGEYDGATCLGDRRARRPDAAAPGPARRRSGRPVNGRSAGRPAPPTPPIAGW